LVIEALDPDWIRIRIGLQPQTMDPDPEKMNTDPTPWLNTYRMYLNGTYHAQASELQVVNRPSFQIWIEFRY
jgi:hypothetical protein